jgi:hypothetical protein
MELHSSLKWFFLLSCSWITMSCTVYTMSCSPTTHATCPLAFIAYKYSELQMSFTIQKLSFKASCKTFFLLIVNIVPFLLYISSSKWMSSCLLWSLKRFAITFLGHYNVLSPIVAQYVFFFHLATWTYKLEIIIFNWLLSPFTSRNLWFCNQRICD